MKAEEPAVVDVVVKLGGSAITDKSKLETLKPQQLKIASQHIRRCKDLGLTCVVVHGAGSFGHHHAKAYGVNQGLRELKMEDEKHRRMKGFCLTRQSVTKLNKMVVDSLIDEGVPAVSCSPGVGWTTRQRQPIKWPAVELGKQLQCGLVPVLHGDCALDEDLGCCILSGDTVIKAICSHFYVKRVIFFTDVAGVYDKPPDQDGAQLLKDIQVDSNGTPRVQIASSCSLHDVTGGIRLKLQSAADIVSTTSSTVYICSVDSREAELITLGQNLDGDDLQLTRISCNSD